MASRSVAELEAELAVRRLEEALAAAKADGPAPRDLKLELREARRAHRLIREGRDPDDGEARTDTIEVTSTIEGAN